MGAFQVWHIEWKDKESKRYFEKLGIHQRILCSYSYWPESNETTYHMGWDGYGLGQIVLKRLKKAKLMKQIIKFVSMDLTCESGWWDEINQCCISQSD